MSQEQFRQLETKYDNKIKNQSVLLTYQGERGTGFLFCPKEDPNAFYIMTVAHVVNPWKARTGKLVMKFSNNTTVQISRNEFDACTVPDIDNQIDLEKWFQKAENYECNQFDVVALRISKNCLPKDMQMPDPLSYLPPKQETFTDKALFFGSYGNPLTDNVHMPLHGNLTSWDKGSNMLIGQFDSDAVPPNYVVSEDGEKLDFNNRSQAAGYSGAPILVEWNEQELVLAGFVCYIPEKQRAWAFYIVGPEKITQAMKQKKWIAPEDCTHLEIPSNFADIENETLNRCHKCDSINNLFYEQIDELKMQFPEEIKTLAETERYLDVPECKYKGENRKFCKQYWAGRLLMLLLLKVLDVPNNELLHPQLSLVEKSGDEEKIVPCYLCSENTGEQDVDDLVSTILKKCLLLNEKDNKLLLFWDSNQNQGYYFAKRGQIRRIRQDLVRTANSSREYDLIRGNVTSKEFAVLHRRELLNRLQGVPREELADKLKEVLNDVWN